MKLTFILNLIKPIQSQKFLIFKTKMSHLLANLFCRRSLLKNNISSPIHKLRQKTFGVIQRCFTLFNVLNRMKFIYQFWLSFKTKLLASQITFWRAAKVRLLLKLRNFSITKSLELESKIVIQKTQLMHNYLNRYRS